MKIRTSVDCRKLKTRKKSEPKFLVLLSNQVCVIDSYWPAIKRAMSENKQILEILPVRKRVKAQVGMLDKIINLDNETEQGTIY